MTEIKVVESFLAALEALDLDGALEYVDDKIVYQNNNLPPARGVKAFARQMNTGKRFGDYFEARIHHIAQDGPVVLTQRTDALGAQGKRWEFWVWGAFEVRDGKIVSWHDNFDWAQFTGRSLASLPGIALNAVLRRRSR